MITVDRLRELLSVSESGLLTWRVSRGSVVAGSPAGTLHDKGYLQVQVDRSRLKSHRVVYALTHGRWPEGPIDHLNGIRDDNRPCNLREATHAINSQNRRTAIARSKAGLLGVASHRERWQARITVNGERTYLGTFDTAQEAHEVYVVAKREMHDGSTL